MKSNQREKKMFYYYAKKWDRSNVKLFLYPNNRKKCVDIENKLLFVNCPSKNLYQIQQL